MNSGTCYRIIKYYSLHTFLHIFIHIHMHTHTPCWFVTAADDLIQWLSGVHEAPQNIPCFLVCDGTHDKKVKALLHVPPRWQLEWRAAQKQDTSCIISFKHRTFSAHETRQQLPAKSNPVEQPGRQSDFSHSSHFWLVGHFPCMAEEAAHCKWKISAIVLHYCEVPLSASADLWARSAMFPAHSLCNRCTGPWIVVRWKQFN